MKIATFNIWNSNAGMPLRHQQIVKEIKQTDADIICLQEVKTKTYENLVNEILEYIYSYFHDSESEYDGLAIFSKHEIKIKKHMQCAIVATILLKDVVCMVVNVHLPWDSIIKKEKYTVDIINQTKTLDVDFAILTGDFNCSDSSSVHHFLIGERTLFGDEASPIWEDMAEVYAQRSNTKPEYTLDIINNPRWKGKDSAETSVRFDRIYLRDAFPKSTPALKNFWVFGKQIDRQSGYCASDHYGVAAEIVFSADSK